MLKQDYTFVVQGPVGHSTAGLLLDIRKFFPKSKVIISTCDSTIPNEMNADEIIQLPDPGELWDGPYSLIGYRNMARLRTNTLAGLQTVRTPMAIKVRSDIRLVNGNCMYFTNPPTKLGFFGHSIIVRDYWTWNPEIRPLHPSDHFQIGYTEDLVKLWDVPQFSYQIYLEFEKKYDKVLAKCPRLAAEQYWLMASMVKNGLSPNDVDVVQFFIDNFVSVDSDLLGIIHPERKRDYEYNKRTYDLLSYEKWKDMART